eukprot:c3604_g1_i1.p1 GENE.c3604_g1_i1~~c3604_g1_i1.p1  ORF type:complete len:305 (+),score=120.27 c3604_g1_i1:20-934(+)
MLRGKEIFSSRAFGGFVKKFTHQSEVCGGLTMTFGAYIPAKATQMSPTLYWLSGLTCTEENFLTKASVFEHAAKWGIVLIVPDTSPRGAKVEGEDDSYDFGTGAGFYVDATEPKWKKHYNMYSYITQELPNVVTETLANSDLNANVDHARCGIFGHSMGGHGALVAGLRNPSFYKSISAFAPIVNPINSPWGKKAFTGYLGSDRRAWKQYDATELLKTYVGPPLPSILIDQGLKDQFLKEQLLPENFKLIFDERQTKLKEDGGKVDGELLYRSHEGYDHSYYFISTFIGDHLNHHAKLLGCEPL